eukprot:TRINITY_DN12091_c0_g1_i1.p1 TRINITY_DN12091_c0_g1~~TRINITY_DN12091_c0_g1_i1.p1  ORF type:complete len:366 (+),score=92.78 TRINITY_DN12091_c0_g1_i1:31-1098(+)
MLHGARRSLPRGARAVGVAVRHVTTPPVFEPPACNQVVSELTRSILQEKMTRHLGPARVPSNEEVTTLIEFCRELMFPGFFTRRGLTKDNLALHVQELVARIQMTVEEQVSTVLRYAHDIGKEEAEDEECGHKARLVARTFVGQLPEIRRLLALDVQAAYDGDPAAIHPDETVFCYPGVYGIFVHRIAHALYNLNVPLLPRMIQEHAHSRCGIDIHPGAQIGERFFIDHGAGVIIGQTSIIGEDVRIYQGVTIGATSFELDKSGQLKRTGGTKRHPTIGDRVTIYSGAVILGGETTIGDDCIIAGSVFLTESVPPGHLVHQDKPKPHLREVRHRLIPRREAPPPKPDVTSWWPTI